VPRSRARRQIRAQVFFRGGASYLAIVPSDNYVCTIGYGLRKIGETVTGTGPHSGTIGGTAEFAFLPAELVTECRLSIERYHTKHGYFCLADLLWRTDARRMIESHDELQEMFKDGMKWRSVK
jgi:hypothetical protein